jgi:hypothetical protein
MTDRHPKDSWGIVLLEKNFLETFGDGCCLKLPSYLGMLSVSEAEKQAKL